MRNYLIRRLIIFVFIFILMTALIYFFLRLPGDPFKEIETLQPHMKDEIARMREWSGFNDPWYVGYFKWSKRLIFDGDWGKSLYDKQPVFNKIAQKLPYTLKINISILILELLIGIPLGIFMARRQYSVADYTLTVVSYIGISMPSFWFGLLLMLLFSLYLKWLPAGWSLWEGHDQMNIFMKALDQIRNFTLPVLMGVFGGSAYMSRYMRTQMLDVIRQDYVRTARSKGLSEGKVVYKHALRNALLPMVTLMTFTLPGLLGGSPIVEQIFNINGMGKMMLSAVTAADIPVAMGTLTMFAFLNLLSLILADILYASVDPRITFS